MPNRQIGYNLCDITHRILLLNFTEMAASILRKAGYDVERGFIGKYEDGFERIPFQIPHPFYDYDALAYLHKLQEKIHSTHYHSIAERITLSVGYCTVSADSVLTDAQILEAANRAKEFAKNSGKNCIATYKGLFFSKDDLQIVRV